VNPKNKVAKWEMLVGVFLRAMKYSIAEVILLVTVIVMVQKDAQWDLFLWIVFASAALWVVTVSSNSSEALAKELVLLRELFITDFVASAVLLIITAVLVLDSGWQFSGMLLLASGQNLRYTGLSIQWLSEEKRAKRKGDFR